MGALAIVKRWWRNTKELPFPLDMLCQGAMVAGPILLVFLVLPIVEWTINGRQMSYAELWKSGAGLAFGLFLFLLMIGAWGLAAQSHEPLGARRSANCAIRRIGAIPELGVDFDRRCLVWHPRRLVGGSNYVCVSISLARRSSVFRRWPERS
jgi:hypothetical protein